MRYLGVDYGKRKVGLAISEGLTASPLRTLEVSSLVDAVNKVLQVIKAEGVETLVVGLPESGESRGMVEKFVSEIGKYAKVEKYPETLSSHSAREQLITIGKNQKGRGEDDAVAASIILQAYLDEN